MLCFALASWRRRSRRARPWGRWPSAWAGRRPLSLRMRGIERRGNLNAKSGQGVHTNWRNYERRLADQIFNLLLITNLLVERYTILYTVHISWPNLMEKNFNVVWTDWHFPPPQLSLPRTEKAELPDKAALLYCCIRKQGAPVFSFSPRFTLHH